MNVINILLIGFFGFICVYAIVDRICKCFENRSMSNAYKEFLKNTKDIEKTEEK